MSGERCGEVVGRDNKPCGRAARWSVFVPAIGPTMGHDLLGCDRHLLRLVECSADRPLGNAANVDDGLVRIRRLS